MTEAPRNLLTVWADRLLDALAAAGITDVVASPGSRSTPYLLAASRRADLTIHSVIDERAAGFFALGMARVTGRPPLLLCTSGTAPAHYYPAVIEASEAAIPLVILSADRPLALRGRGAPQTTDQVDLYGRHARHACDLGDPAPTDDALRGLVGAATRAVERALGPVPGPVQINAPAQKPLEPVAAETADEHDLVERAARVSVAPIARSAIELDAASLAPIRDALARAERPALVAGPLPVDAPREAILDFLRRTGITLFAEAGSQLRFGPRPGVRAADSFEWWLDRQHPDVILEIGATPTTGRYLRWLDAGPPARRFVLGGDRFRDPSGTAAAVVLGDLGAIVGALADDADRSAPFEAIEARTWARLDATLGDALTEATAVRRVLERLDDGALAALGNSLPIRHADRYVRGGGARRRVITQRGVNGIDGWVAASAGAAAATGEPLVTLIGDVTFAHDVGALSLAARAATPLVFVVLDNGGGRIFEQLPVAEAGVDMALFTTPSGVDAVAAARAFGVAAADVTDLGGLDAALDEALARHGATVLRCVVDPSGARDQVRAVRAALEAAS